MYVCHCRAITDRTIRAAIAAGARTIEEVREQCSAGTRCQGCWPALAELLAESQAPERAAGSGDSLHAA